MGGINFVYEKIEHKVVTLFRITTIFYSKNYKCKNIILDYRIVFVSLSYNVRQEVSQVIVQHHV